MVYKQHFIDWFSGKSGASYWNIQNPSGSGASLVGKDEVNGGMIFTSGTGGNNNGFCGFNGKNQFAHDGFVQIAVWRLDPSSSSHSYIQVICGMGAQTNDNGQNSAHWTIRRNQTYIDYRTKNSGGSGGFTSTTTPVDEVFHHTKIQANSASSYDFTLDHVLAGTNTSNLPSASMSPFLKCDDSGQQPDVLGIKYMECYNT